MRELHPFAVQLLPDIAMILSKTTYDWLIVGLGNPGKEYAGSRHNTGWMALDLLAGKLGTKIDRVRFRGRIGSANCKGQKLLLLEPETYMNASGLSVEAAAHFYRLPPERVLVIFDDISLPVGKIRVRKDGSAGGHNGIKSIIAMLHSDEFPRVKVGVGAKPHPDYDLAAWVLGSVPKEEQSAYQQALENAADAALCVVTEGTEKAASLFNGK